MSQSLWKFSAEILYDDLRDEMTVNLGESVGDTPFGASYRLARQMAIQHSADLRIHILRQLNDELRRAIDEGRPESLFSARTVTIPLRPLDLRPREDRASKAAEIEGDLRELSRRIEALEALGEKP